MRTGLSTDKRAFSLMEMLIVMGIMIVIAKISLDSFGVKQSQELNDAGNQVFAMITLAKEKAKTLNTLSAIAFHMKSDSGVKTWYCAALVIDANGQWSPASKWLRLPATLDISFDFARQLTSQDPDGVLRIENQSVPLSGLFAFVFYAEGNMMSEGDQKIAIKITESRSKRSDNFFKIRFERLNGTPVIERP